MKIHTYGFFFWHTIPVKQDAPFHLRARTNEAESPYRTSHSHVFYFWPFKNRALVFGLWKKTGYDETQAMEALLRTDVDNEISRYETEEVRGFRGLPDRTKKEQDRIDLRQSTSALSNDA